MSFQKLSLVTITFVCSTTFSYALPASSPTFSLAPQTHGATDNSSSPPGAASSPSGGNLTSGYPGASTPQCTCPPTSTAPNSIGKAPPAGAGNYSLGTNGGKPPGAESSITSPSGGKPPGAGNFTGPTGPTGTAGGKPPGPGDSAGPKSGKSPGGGSGNDGKGPKDKNSGAGGSTPPSGTLPENSPTSGVSNTPPQQYMFGMGCALLTGILAVWN